MSDKKMSDAKMSDEKLKALLRSYNAPVADEGFSALVMEGVMDRVEAQAAGATRLRKFALYGAFFIGGAAAAVQLPKLAGLIAGAYSGVEQQLSRLPLPQLSPSDGQGILSGQSFITETLSNAPSYSVFVGLGVMLYLIWAAIDGETLRM